MYILVQGMPPTMITEHKVIAHTSRPLLRLFFVFCFFCLQFIVREGMALCGHVQNKQLCI